MRGGCGFVRVTGQTLSCTNPGEATRHRGCSSKGTSGHLIVFTQEIQDSPVSRPSMGTGALRCQPLRTNYVDRSA
jgi:hypothetical protein